MSRPRILIVEDDPAILSGLLDVLVFHGYDPTGESDGETGLDAALSGRFDLIILDLMLPSMDGFRICETVRRRRPGQGILMLTARGAEDDLVRGLAAGADDYVTKPFSLRELMARVEALLRRTGRAPETGTFHFGGAEFDPASLLAHRDGRELPLTRREMDLVRYFHDRPDRIVSKKELLLDVWRYADADIETRTVEIHIQKLRKKLGPLLNPGVEIRTIRGEGYRVEAME